MQASDIPAVNRILKREYEKKRAPIIELIKAETRDPFKVLVGTILSARTRDETTSEVCKRLFKKVKRPHDFDRLTRRQLEKLLLPIGFFRTKARHLKELPAVLDERFGGRVPDGIDDLCKLPGVGRKTANLVRSVGFDKPAICVDVHVNRICNRLGLLQTRNPSETEMVLREILPVRYWKTWNRYLVSYGQTICTPLNPHCATCPIHRYCDRVRVMTKYGR
jgi:endonuclease III